MKAARVEEFPTLPECGEQVVAEVQGRADGGWLVNGSSLKGIAKQATSCLLEPEPGDRALVFLLAGQCWILAILERKGSQPLTVSTDRDLVFRSMDGSVEVNGATGVNLQSKSSISMDSPSFRLRSRIAEVVVGKLDWLGQQLDAHVDGVRYVGRLFESVVDRFSRRSRSSFREVDEIDQVRSKHVDYRADGNMCLRGRTVMAKGKDLVKLDGDQIHMG